MSTKTKLTPRREALASRLGAGQSPYVAQVRHINRHGRPTSSKVYHYNVPAHLYSGPGGRGFIGGHNYALICNPSGGYIVVEVLKFLAPGHYDGAVEWLVAPILGPELLNYIAAERLVKTEVEHRARVKEERAALAEELGAKRDQLEATEAKWERAKTRYDSALKLLGRKVLNSHVGISQHREVARGLQAEALELAKACDTLAVEIRDLEARL